jgi:hypothetical protein
MTADPRARGTQRPPSRWSAGRIVLLLLGLVLLLPGLALLAGGGVLLWSEGTQRTPDGYLTTDSGSFGTPGFALTSDRLDLSTGADWPPLASTLGTARLEVARTDGGDVFVGIAPVADAGRYLDGVRRTVVDDVGRGLDAGDQRLVEGGAPSGPPGAQDFWAARSSGPGLQQLGWRPADGDWVLVVMNADGSAGVSVNGAVGATVPNLDVLAWGLLGVGAALTIVGVLLVVLAVRRGRSRPPAGWAPPAPRSPADADVAWKARSGTG